MRIISIVGKVTNHEVYLVSNEPFIQNEYFVIDDNEGGVIPIEVTDVFSFRGTRDDIIPGFNEKYDGQLIGSEGMKYFSKAAILIPIYENLSPELTVRNPEYEEIKGTLFHAKKEDSFKLGIIQGTQMIFDDLPKEMQDLSPLWRNGLAVPQDSVPFLFDYRKIREYPHLGLFGTSGSGKTFGLRVICEELMEKGIPGIALDPHSELEFSKPMDGLEHMRCEQKYKDRHSFLVVGKDVGIPFEDITFDELRYLIEFIGSLSEAMSSALESIHDKGDTLLHLKNKLLRLRTAYEIEEKKSRSYNNGQQEEMDEDTAILYSKYRNKIASTGTLQGLIWRIDGLEATGIFDSSVGIEAVEREMYDGKLVILRGNMMLLQMVSFYAIRKLYKKRRSYQENMSEKPYFPMFFIIVDEAHNFCPKHSTSPTKRILKEIAQEARKYGVYEVFCTQRPEGLDDTIFAQINNKIIYRINTQADIELVQRETNLTEEQMRQLPNLTSGSCFFASSALPKTYAVQFRSTYTKSPHQSDPFSELYKKNNESQGPSRLEKVLTELCPSEGWRSANIRKSIDNINDKLGEEAMFSEITKTLDAMVDKHKMRVEKTPAGSIYRKS